MAKISGSSSTIEPSRRSLETGNFIQTPLWTGAPAGRTNRPP
jgi:hypothetical protein